MIIKQVYHDLGISYFFRLFETGEGLDFVHQLDTVQDSENITVLISGKLRTYNSNRMDYLDVEAGPFRIAGGTLLPGTYVIEALEPSEFCCIAKLSKQHLKAHSMFTLEHIHLEAGKSHTFRSADQYRAVLVMKGECRINGTGDTIKTAQRYDVKDEVTFEAVIDTHLVGYKV